MNSYTKKYYNRETGNWEPLYSTEGMSAYETAKLNGFTGTEEEFNDAISKAPLVIKAVYNQHSYVLLESDKNIIEKGISTPIELTIKSFFNDQEITPISIILKKNGQIISEDININTWSDSISETTTYTADSEFYNEVIKHSEVIINACLPQYIGSSNKEIITITDIETFIQQPLSENVIKEISIDIDNGEYLWICVPNSMEINKLFSGGIEVPINEKITINIDENNFYNCYRSSSTFVAGTFNGVIS